MDEASGHTNITKSTIYNSAISLSNPKWVINQFENNVILPKTCSYNFKLTLWSWAQGIGLG